MNDRQAALDEWATSQTENKPEILVPATITHAPPPQLIHGAQLVLVPRDEGKVLQRIKTLAAAAGDAWYYRIPFKDRKTGKTTFVEGPSIKLANDVARLYGSCDVDEWVSGEGLDYWEFTARFIDLESGYALTRVFRQRKDAAAVGKSETRNAEIGFAIGASKAIRNVVVNALQTFSDYAYEEARNALVATVGKDIERWRQQVSERIGALVDIRRVEMVVGRSVKDWLAPDIAQIAAMGKAIKDGMATVDETFPPIQTQEHKTTKDQLDKTSGGSEQSPPEEGAPEAGSVSDDGGRTLSDASSPEQQPPGAPAPEYKASDRKEATTKLLELAHDERIAKETRLEALEDAAGHWQPLLEPDYFQALIKGAISIVKGFANLAEVKKTLGTFK